MTAGGDAAGSGYSLAGRLAGASDDEGREILGVVHHVVHAEDRNARLGRAIDEAANQVLLDGLRADAPQPA